MIEIIKDLITMNSNILFFSFKLQIFLSVSVFLKSSEISWFLPFSSIKIQTFSSIFLFFFPCKILCTNLFTELYIFILVLLFLSSISFFSFFSKSGSNITIFFLPHLNLALFRLLHLLKFYPLFPSFEISKNYF